MNQKKMYIPLILGTARIERQSEKVADFILKEIEKRGDIETELVDVKDHLFGRTIPSWEESKEASVWRDIAERADGFFIVFPEYNSYFPGELKILLDSADDKYERKAVALSSVSAGNFGGVRGLEHLRPLLSKMELVVIPEVTMFSNVKDLFDTEGNMIDGEKYKKRISEELDSLVDFSRALKSIRK